MHFSYNKLLLYILLFVITCSSCKKFLDVGNPRDQIVAKYVYQSNTSAANVLTGIYFDLSQQGSWAQGQYGFSAICALSADELVAFPTNYSLNGLYTNNFGGDGFWSLLYAAIYRTNAAIEGLSATTTLTPAVQKQLLGEAKFIRAFCYFYLVNLYGDVPILTVSDYKVNAVATRSSAANVYKQIISDLQEAQNMLNDNYVDQDAITTTLERIRPNKWTATALLARVYLYTSNWSAAATQAGMVIDNKSLFDTVALNDVFLKNSRETIWQLQPNYIVADFFNTLDARTFVLENGPDESEHPFWVSHFLLDEFENGDQREVNWIAVDSSTGIAYYFPFKYKLYKPEDPQGEYLMVFRLAEQYLIRAEARAQLGQLGDARLDLDVIRRRAGLNATTASTKEPLLATILHERHVELFTEWGHRWLDLKRTGMVNTVMAEVTPQKGGTWQSYKQLYPLPFGDLQLNPNLIQNEGYSH
ncbi:SusD family protein [Chitinophaga sp. YR573]|uniref:RagB/SusD family nutrient uptake outer membrane protein n=1 Tax=Chitinophaga sp. YR573 TaxID=1881040 RepID=UPI0008D08894|nr:RagB/SusD family nutrient uptake outer membrane protein [Chitinophaga sp. YR573]SEW04029.1 SusD family protein [Chitinophaga sp. YR573]